MAQSTKVGDYVDFLQTLDHERKAYFLEGGQAVNFWAEYYSAKSATTKLDGFRPFTSKDCDIWVSLAALNYLKSASQQGSLIMGTSPADGQIGVFTIEGNAPLVVDLMGGVYGIPVSENQRLCARALNFEGVHVLDPIYLLKNKSHCLMELDQTDRQDERHVAMMICIMPEYLAELLNRVKQGELDDRNFIKEVKIMLKVCQDKRVIAALDQLTCDVTQLFPMNEFSACKLEMITKYTEMTLTPSLVKIGASEFASEDKADPSEPVPD